MNDSSKRHSQFLSLIFILNTVTTKQFANHATEVYLNL